MLRCRYGIPTRKSLRAFISEFDGKVRIYIGHLYGKRQGRDHLVWQDTYTENRIGALVQALRDVGVNVGNHEPYSSLRTGSLQILPNGKKL